MRSLCRTRSLALSCALQTESPSIRAVHPAMARCVPDEAAAGFPVIVAVLLPEHRFDRPCPESPAHNGIPRGSSRQLLRPAVFHAPYLVHQIRRIIWTMELSRANAVFGVQADAGLGLSERALQIRRHKLSRNSSRFGDGRHLRGAAGSSPARFQQPSRTSRL